MPRRSAAAIPVVAMRPVVLLFLVVGFARLSAQDVIVGDVQWLTPAAPNETPPKRASRIRLGYPSEFKAADTLGYVIMSQATKAGPDGHDVFRFSGTHPPFARVVQELLSHGDLRELVYRGKSPATTGATWQAFIFNPKSCSSRRRRPARRAAATAAMP